MPARQYSPRLWLIHCCSPPAGEELEAVILDMDRVLQYDALLQASVAGGPPPSPARVYAPEDVAAVSTCAQKLLILACEQVRRLWLPCCLRVTPPAS